MKNTEKMKCDKYFKVWGGGRGRERVGVLKPMFFFPIF
jgi:hypothetical protein